MQKCPKKRQVQHIRGWRYWIIKPVIWLISLWLKTLRVSIENEHYSKTAPKGVIIALWHNRLFAAPYIFKRFGLDRSVYPMVSASQDGAWLSAILAHYNMKALRGSSSWRGRAALTDAMRLIKQGGDVAITPDGPRGPKYDVKPGVSFLLSQLNCPLYLIGINYSSAWKLKSWDQFCIPKPFSRMTITIKEYILDGTLQEKELSQDIKSWMDSVTND